MTVIELINKLKMLVEGRDQEVVYLHNTDEECEEYTHVTDAIEYEGRIAILGRWNKEALREYASY
jgi:hypothetical protein